MLLLYRESAKSLTYVPVKSLYLPDFIHAMPPVATALHGCLHTVALELGLQIVQAQLNMAHTLPFNTQLQSSQNELQPVHGRLWLWVCVHDVYLHAFSKLSLEYVHTAECL